jgi:hypothetical protein
VTSNFNTKWPDNHKKAWILKDFTIDQSQYARYD